MDVHRVLANPRRRRLRAAPVRRGPDAAIPLSGSFVGFRSDDLGMQVTVKVTREEAEDDQNEAGASMSLSA